MQVRCANQPLLETLLVNVKQNAMPLVFDNCEHVSADVATVADALRIPATSRAPLHIAGESTYRLPSLPVLYVAVGLCNLAAYLIACDRWHEARAHALEAVDIARENQLPVFLAYALQRMAATLCLAPSDRSARASAVLRGARLTGHVDARIWEFGSKREYTEQREYDRITAALDMALGVRERERLMAAGARMTTDEAIASVER